MATHKTLLTSSVQVAYTVVNTIMYMQALCRKMADYIWPFNGESAGSLQLSGFREKPTSFWTSIAH